MATKRNFKSDASEAIHSSASAMLKVGAINGTVEKWTTGAKQPSGMALKLRAVVQKHGLEALV